MGNNIRFCSEQFGIIDLVYDLTKICKNITLFHSCTIIVHATKRMRKGGKMPIRQSFLMKIGLLGRVSL